MSVVGITENAKGDNKKFEVWCNSREEVYIVQVHEPVIKTGTLFLTNGLFIIWERNIQFILTSSLFVTFKAPTAEVKTTWVNEIRKVLTTQLEACRGTDSYFQFT